MRARVGRAVLYVLLVLLLVVPVLLLAHPISYVPLAASVLMLAFSYAYLQVVRRGVSVDVGSMAGTCERGASTRLCVTVANSCPLPCVRLQMELFVTDLFGGYDDVQRLSCSVGGNDAVEVGFDVSFAHVGSYTAGVQGVVVYDLLGLFSSTLAHAERRQVTVRPRAARMGDVAARTVVADESRKALRPVADDDVDYASVREYRYGDPLKTVHWNLSAREPGPALYTRLYETYVSPTLAIVIDPYAEAAEPETLMAFMDGMVETSVELCKQARAQGIDAEIRYIDREGRAAAAHVASANDAALLVDRMMRIACDERGREASAQAHELLQHAGLRAHGCGNVALVAASAQPAELETLVRTAANRRNAMAFVATPRGLVGRERERYLAPLQRLAGTGATWWAVESNALATEVVGL